MVWGEGVAYGIIKMVKRLCRRCAAPVEASSFCGACGAPGLVPVRPVPAAALLMFVLVAILCGSPSVGLPA